MSALCAVPVKEKWICYYHVHILKYVNPVNKPISLGMEPFNWLRAGLKTKKMKQDILELESVATFWTRRT